MKITASLLLATLTVLTLLFYLDIRDIMSEMSEDTLDYYLLNKHAYIFLFASVASFILLVVKNRNIFKTVRYETAS